MSAMAPPPATRPLHVLDVYVADDGSVVPVDASLLLSSEDDSRLAPPELVDLALGLLAEEDQPVDFVWLGDPTAPYWNIHLERVALGRTTVARLRGSRTTDLAHALTRRELDVVTLMIAGLSNAAIAEALTVSPRTVTTHVDRIMRKFAAPSRSAAATAALDSGVVAVPLPMDASEFQTLRIGRVVRSAGTRRQTTRTSVAESSPNAPIVVGSLVPLEGRAREDGVEMIRGATLAIDEINARGGVRGRPLQLFVQHVDIDRAGLSNVTEATHRLLSRGVHAITTGYLLHQARAVELAAAEGVPLLHASASSYIDDLVTTDPQRFRGIFQVCPNDRNYAPNFVDFMTKLRDSGQWHPPSRELVIAQQNIWNIIDFGVERAAHLADEHGWTLIPMEVSDWEESDEAWTTLAGRIGQPAAVMLGSFFANDHLRFLYGFLAKPAQCLIYSIYAPSMPSFRRRAGAHANGLLWSSTTGTYSDQFAQQFADAYRSKFSALPGRSMAGIAYDRIQILAQAWVQVDDVHDYDAVSSSLMRTRYRGVNGSYSFTGEGHGTLPLGTKSNDPSIAQAHTIFQIQGGQNVLLDPDLYATGTFMRPSWMTSG